MAFNTVSADSLEFNVPVPYEIAVDAEFLEVTKRKLADARYPREQDDFPDNDWSQGAKVKEVKRMAEFWKNDYNWKTRQDEINKSQKQYLVKLNVPGYGPLVLHFTHQKSSQSNAIPLLFCHGWPGSFLEARHVMGPLSQSSGTDGNMAYHVVVPSIPGFGFSPAPTKSGVGPSTVAKAYKILMVDVLNYNKGFLTQGGDFGSFISRSLAIQYPDLVIAQHLNMFPVPPPTLSSAPMAYLRWCLSGIMYSDFEKKSLDVRRNFEKDQSGYLEQQKTRPQTLGFALGDSPLGLLAWFVEKFHDWVDVDGSGSLSDTEALDLVMMHWIQGATPGLRFYREAFWGGKRDAEETFETYVAVPTGVSMYAKEQLHCPRDWAAQAANITFWREHAQGGHFSSLEHPKLFVEDLRTCFSSAAVKKSITKHLGADALGKQ